MDQQHKPYVPIALWSVLRWRALDAFLRGNPAEVGRALTLSRERAPRAAAEESRAVNRPSRRTP